MNNVAFTSDTHAFHENIIRYSNRPFVNVDEMNAVLAKNINKTLPQGGLLYHLGDWSFGNLEKAFQFNDMINNNIDIILIKGNHDGRNLRDEAFRKLFREIHELVEVNVNGQKIILCHYAMRVWNKSHHGVWHLYGHSHGSLPDDPNSLSFDIGVDCHNFKPLTMPEIKAIMDKKTWKSIDHHGRNHEV